MIYSKGKSTIIEGFGVTQEQMEELVKDNFYGSREDILDRICHDNTMSDSVRFALLINFGTSLVFDEIGAMSEALRKDDDSPENIPEESADLP